MAETFDDTVEAGIREYVLTRARLGIYDPLQPRRPQVPVVSFDVELWDFDAETRFVHAAGPVILRTATGEVERFLRVSVVVDSAGCIVEGAEMRAVYVVETNPENGACKETAALANV